MPANAQRARSVGFPGPGVTGNWVLPDVGAGNHTWVLYKSTESPLQYLAIVLNGCGGPGPTHALFPIVPSFS